MLRLRRPLRRFRSPAHGTPRVVCTAFLNRIFVADPAARASFDDLLEDPWLKAETLSLDALRADLTRRKTAVQRQKRLEKEAEEAKRAAAAATAAFDPFARDVNRAVGEDKPDAPALPSTVAKRYTFFYSRLHPAALTERLEQAFSSMSAKYTTDESKYKIKATVNTTTGQQVAVVARVYAHPDGQMHVVDVSRRAGDMLKFQEVYNVLCDLVGDVVCAPPKSASTDAGEDESKVDAADAAAAAAVESAAAAALAAAEAAVAAAAAAAPAATTAAVAPAGDDDGLL